MLTAEQFKEFLETDEGSTLLNEIIDSKIKEGGFKSEEDVKGLINKNKELIGKIKNLKGSAEKNSLTEETTKMLDILNEHDILSSEELAEVISSPKGNSDTTPKEDLKLKRRLKELEVQNAEMQSFKALAESERQLRVSSEKKALITSALKKAGVKDTSFDFSYAYFNDITTSEIDDEGNLSFVAKDEDGLSPSINAFIEEWSKTEKAQPHIQKPQNSGAGNLLNGKSSNPTMSRAEYNKIPPKQQMEAAMKYDIVD